MLAQSSGDAHRGRVCVVRRDECARVMGACVCTVFLEKYLGNIISLTLVIDLLIL